MAWAVSCDLSRAVGPRQSLASGPEAGESAIKSVIKTVLARLGYHVIAAPSAGGQSSPARDKVFCIGANKTGTTSVERALRDLGLRLPEQGQQERLLTRRVLGGDAQALAEFCAAFDAFQDLPFSHGLVFATCDALFPDAKFILTVRDADDWFNSVCRFQSKVFDVDVNADPKDIRAVFENATTYLDRDYARDVLERSLLRVSDNRVEPDWAGIFDRDQYIARYDQRNKLILKYFWGRCDKLLVVDVRQEATTERLVRFLGLDPDLIGPMPHENAT